ncbi:protease [Oharaeibacter diazotrophicus]|uniref:Uncharacterized membrane protein HdeD (DUF308 family) n=1 Tax=Oharaeibacter diazotrophicus TaxID=1920512 RepID=A0A4R6RKZ4_9HYPH|nr:protease [Oharaeibacter diazotrophicus]TDP87164.1 uncharacterized membrane protein HdeD (DUF308 family) [Oharaeibacter diazotrophicus]BBE70893.1 hypothetical protein OHA_1_00461 [Pleomorphomonas sp. SM30]GLS77642.1 hypothetical protein GCM10007904_29790 [Oharaeibacter diazotrophicus]
MLKLAFLLIGPASFRSKWYVLAVLGGLLVALALVIAADASDRVTLLAQTAIGLVFVANGVVSAMSAALGRVEGSARFVTAAKALGLVLIGALVMGVPVRTDVGLAVFVGLALVLDGIWRIGFAFLVRYGNWRAMATFGAVELLLALLLYADWPLPPGRNVAVCIGLLIALWGVLLIRMGLMLRTLDDEVAILNLPVFGGRGWYDHAPVLIDTGETVAVEHPLTVRIWTPVGSAYEPERRLLIDRYIAAVDGNGVMSTGHSALEMKPDLYISHYPAVELDRSRADFMASFRGTAENDFKGRFQPSYEHECAEWCPADGNVEFRNYDPRRLRAFWVGYRQDDTYNLTNRNCSVAVAAALDAALEGSLATRFAWARLVGLLLNPDLWVAAMICNRAASMTWTPGLVLDYARTLARIVERGEVGWTARLFAFFARLRRGGAPDNEPRTA